MRISTVLFVPLFLMQASPAQTRHPRGKPTPSVAAERLGLTCAEILAMSSTDWVAKFDKDKGSIPQGTERATAAYGTCYTERTDRLVVALTRKRAGPPKSARADFAGFEDAVKGFTKTAIADAQPAPDGAKIAYVDLYEKQFLYEFYREYEDKNLHPTLTPAESDQFTKAKNRFGELLGLLPDAKAHQVHAAFGEIVGTHQVSMAIKLALYRYAIFTLEPPTEKPFAPPPF
jgi:hypothetical protein